MIDQFSFRNGSLRCENVNVADLAEHYGTPLFVYSEAAIRNNLSEIQVAFAAAKPILCYSVKANGNLSLCRLIGSLGAGFDVTSGGEYHRAILAKPDAQVCFAGVGKTDAEIRFALEKGVFLFDVESEQELHRLGEVAKGMDKVAPAALRVNPDLPPKTHVKTDTSVKGVKFGLDIETVLEVAQDVVGHPHVKVVGLHMHLGSPILSAAPYEAGAKKAVALIEALRKQGHEIRYLNMGGGFGISYRQEEALPASAFAAAILPAVEATQCQLVLEPGRFVVGNAGVLVSRVLFTKETGGRSYVIQDASMTDLIRPTLYDAFHRIWPVQPGTDVPEWPADFEATIPGTRQQDVVGPVCESGDYLAKGRNLPVLRRGELLATFSAGAYGMAMASNYNARGRAAEVLVTGGAHRLIRRRETPADLVACEVDCLR